LQETHSKHETERQREKEGERGGGGEESFRDQTDIFGGSLHVECITSGEHLGEWICALVGISSKATSIIRKFVMNAQYI